MLMLKRKPGESIRIHTVEGIIEVSFCSVNGIQTKVGITAPESMDILRSEIDETSDKYEEADR